MFQISEPWLLHAGSLVHLNEMEPSLVNSVRHTWAFPATTVLIHLLTNRLIITHLVSIMSIHMTYCPILEIVFYSVS